MKPLADRIINKHPEYRPFLKQADSFVGMERFLMDVVGLDDVELVYDIDRRALEDVKVLYFLSPVPNGEWSAPEDIAYLSKHLISRAYGLSLGLSWEDGDWSFYAALSPRVQESAQQIRRKALAILLTAYTKAVGHRCAEGHIEACSEFKKEFQKLTQEPLKYERLLKITANMPSSADPIDFCEMVRSDGLAATAAVYRDGIPLEYVKATQ